MQLQRPCPVCNTAVSGSTEFLKENIIQDQITDFSFSSRKAPEYMCHHMVKCNQCDLVYADKPPKADELAEAYHTASYDSNEEANDAAQAYATAIKPIVNKLLQKHSALEIGTGTGVFLDYLKMEGFKYVVGVEPSKAAINTAPEYRQKMIIEGVFDENKFELNSFDLVCCFMTMEHVHNPMSIAHSAMKLLKPGGTFITVTHDYKSTVNRLLGKRSPIIDIEHVQIFSRKSIKELFDRSGYVDVSVKSFVNRYSLTYWIRLSPLPHVIKNYLERSIFKKYLKKYKISFNVGNTITAGYKP